MSLPVQTWERSLINLAYEGRQAAGPSPNEIVHDEAILSAAYAHCEAMTAYHSRSFYLASGLLPQAKRRAARALYAFCRTSDDMVDRPDGDARANLEAWRQHVVGTGDWRLGTGDCELVAAAWAHARTHFHIPQRYVEQLIDGVGRDLVQNRYATFDEVAAYAYGVASTVGLMSMHIIGYQGAAAIPYAVKLGVALQLTNILRDVGEDWAAGRLYLPQAEMADFGLSEEDMAAGWVDARWRAFMRFQIARARQLYRQAWPGIGLLAKDGRPAITAAATFYRAILDDIERRDYDVFRREGRRTKDE